MKTKWNMAIKCIITDTQADLPFNIYFSFMSNTDEVSRTTLELFMNRDVSVPPFNFEFSDFSIFEQTIPRKLIFNCTDRLFDLKSSHFTIFYMKIFFSTFFFLHM